MRSYKDYMSAQPDLQTLAFQAAREGDLFFFQSQLPKHPEILLMRDQRGYSPFMLACYHGHTELVFALLSVGADPGDSDSGGNSVLMGAAFKGHLQVIQTLLAAGADPEKVNDKGQNALHFAQMFGRSEALALLRQGAVPSIREKLKAWLLFLKPSKKTERKNQYV